MHPLRNNFILYNRESCNVMFKENCHQLFRKKREIERKLSKRYLIFDYFASLCFQKLLNIPSWRNIIQTFDRPKTAHRNSRPPTSCKSFFFKFLTNKGPISVFSAHALPSFGNGRIITASKHMKLAMKRSNSETRPLPRIEYGRSPSREKMTDLRDELFHAKKVFSLQKLEPLFVDR